MADDLENAIRDNASGPAEAHGDTGGMRQQLPTQQIEADKYLLGKGAMRRNPAKAFVRIKMIQPGTV